jgi:hypothetical protein
MASRLNSGHLFHSKNRLGQGTQAGTVQHKSKRILNLSMLLLQISMTALIPNFLKIRKLLQN